MNTPVPLTVLEALRERIPCLEDSGKTRGPVIGLVPAIPVDEALCSPDRHRRNKPGDDDRGAPVAVVEALRERIQCLEGGARRWRAVLPFGIKAIDERLPEGGLALGALHEVAGGGNGAVDGAAAALFAAGIAARTRGRVLWCVTRQDLFAPALALVGLAPERVIYVEAGDEKSVLACFEEGLRHGGTPGGTHGGTHGGLGAVVAEVARLSMTASRRLQLAAESSGAIGIAIRRLARLPLPCPSPHAGEGQGAWRGRGTGVSVPFPTLHSLNRVIARESACEEINDLVVALLPARGRGANGATTRVAPTAGDEVFHTLESGRSSNPLRLVKDASPGATGCPPFAGHDTKNGRSEMGRAADFGQPTAAVTRWRVSALPSTPLPVPGVGRARWRLELIRCRGGESAEFEVEACDAQGRLALPSDLVDGSGQETIGQRRAAR